MHVKISKNKPGRRGWWYDREGFIGLQFDIQGNQSTDPRTQYTLSNNEYNLNQLLHHYSPDHANAILHGKCFIAPEDCVVLPISTNEQATFLLRTD